MTDEAAQHNLQVLSEHDMSLEKAIQAQVGSPVSYGSEFRPVDILEGVFGQHPNWKRMKQILTTGSSWPLDELDYSIRKQDLEEALTFGNHKGATQQPDLLHQLVCKDVTYGYALPLPLDAIRNIPGVLMAPMNIQRQNTIDESGQIVEKDRLTHDQSFVWEAGASVNRRVDKSKLLPCRYGACMRRLINWTVAARLKFPNSPIVCSKIDYKSAYRRCHLNATTAVQTCTQLPDRNLALMALRLTFGGSPGPYEWSVISETICDLAIAILHDDEWDLSAIDPPGLDLVPSTLLLDDSIPFGNGRQLVVDIPVDPRGTADVYIDDTIGLAVELSGSMNSERLRRAILLAIHTAARSRHPDEPIPREEMAAIQKLLAEARCEEIKIVLGWLLNFRLLRISLPDNKFQAWSTAATDILRRGSTTAKELECNIGRWTHLGMILPSVHHFLSRLRDLQRRATNRRSIKLTEACIEDLELMLFFLQRALHGISFNLVAYRLPTHLYRSDSCPAGLGGYSHKGKAWRFYIPKNLQFRATNNLLEHIASIITPWIDIISGELKAGDCALSMTDSSTSEGWARKTNFSELCDEEEIIQAQVRQQVAREHARRFLDKEVKDYSQWFPGDDNGVSDALSRDDDRDDEELTHVLRTFVPSQLPDHFEIVPLPSEISSWLTSLLQKLPVRTQLREKHKRSKLGRGHDGNNTMPPSESEMTTTSNRSQEISASNSWERSPWLCEEDDFHRSFMTPWLKAQSEIPFHLWCRPSGRMDVPTLQKTKMANLADFYHTYSERSETLTPPQYNKKPCPSVSSPSLPRNN